MPLVFVHGVNVRYNPGNDPFVAARDALFRRSVMHEIARDPTRARILNPYWGGAAAKFPWNHGGLPSERYERFGSVDTVAATMVNDLSPQRFPGIVGPEGAQAQVDTGELLIDPHSVLPLLAAQSLEAALDALWTFVARDFKADLSTHLAELSLQAGRYALANPRPGWAVSASSNDEFLSRLFRELQLDDSGDARETFGVDEIKNLMRRATDRLRTSVAGIAEATTAGARQLADQMLLKVRTPVHRSLATFVGDLLVYLRQREAGQSGIANIISAALEEADAERIASSEPLVVVAHSMGGNIVYDLLTSTNRPWHIDALVTVGSQVAVIEELKLFTSSDKGVPNETMPKVARPRNVARWLNVFDTLDVLGFAASRVFDGVEDYAFTTGHAWAHGGYFVEPVFHARLANRLRVDR